MNHIYTTILAFLYYAGQAFTLSWGLAPFKNTSVSGENIDGNLFFITLLFANLTLGPLKALIAEYTRRKTVLRFLFATQHVSFLILLYCLCLARTSGLSDQNNTMLFRAVIVFLSFGMVALSATDSAIDRVVSGSLGSATYAFVSTYGQKVGGKMLNALFQDAFKTSPLIVFYSMCAISLIVLYWQFTCLISPELSEKEQPRPRHSFCKTVCKTVKNIANLVLFPPFLMILLEALFLDMIQSSLKAFMVHAKNDEGNYFMGSAGATTLSTFELIAVLLAAKTLWVALNRETNFQNSWQQWSIIHAVFSVTRVALTSYLVSLIHIFKEPVSDGVEPYGFHYHRSGSEFLYRTDDLDDNLFYITILLVMLNAISDTFSSAFLSMVFAKRAEETGISLAAQEGIVRAAQYLPMSLAFLRHVGILSFYKGVQMETLVGLGIFCCLYICLFVWNKRSLMS
jgi:hypothetical protein